MRMSSISAVSEDDASSSSSHAMSAMISTARSSRTSRSRPSTAPAREEVILLPSLPSDNNRMQTVTEDDDPSTLQASRSHSTSPLLNLPTPRTPLPGPVSHSHSATPTYTYDWATFMSAYAAGRWDPHRTPNPPISTALWLTTDTLGEDKDEINITRSPVSDFDGSNSPSDRSSARPSSATKRPSYSRKAPSSNFPLPSHRLRNSFSTASSTPSHNTSLRPNFYIPLASTTNVSSQFTTALASPFLSSSNVTTMSSPSVSASQTAAAALRMAGAHVDLAPLALPSPEHELTDPMRGLNTAIPGSHPEYESPEDGKATGRDRDRKAKFKPRSHLNEVIQDGDESAYSPGGTKKRLSARMESLKEFWGGTQDVDPKYGGMTPPAELRVGKARSQPAATEVESADYFSHQSVPPSQKFHEPSVDYSDAIRSVPVSSSFVEVDIRQNARLARQTSAPLPISIAGIITSASVPSMSTENLGCSADGSARLSQVSSEILMSGQVSTPSTAPEGTTAIVPTQKDEYVYHQSGYLQPPSPPDETDRRRALYKFNIWNTGSDLNFDRIAHLVKLVFNTKSVFISMVDGSEQWFKSEWGLNVSSIPRCRSFCGHSILQRDDEPMVVLDAQSDWRFAQNPLVTGPPYIRFYAGAPLRTQDGFNVGSLAILDDAPREDFTPRHRHTLKEFAAITMREMELWRDKIQLRIRDKIQTSMEEFSRECLENDLEESITPSADADTLSTTSSSGTTTPLHSRTPSASIEISSSSGGSSSSLLATSMDKVYSRAARLIQRTLDVEDVVVIDVSHCEVLESTSAAVHLSSGSLSAAKTAGVFISPSAFGSGAEGTVSVTMYYGDPGRENQSKVLAVEDYVRLSQFFGAHPNGRVFEGLVPPSFRIFLPNRINYALIVPIFNIDKRPFALLCAYNSSDHAKRFLEGHELSYLRAIGVIILSAVLKRRMILADKAKSLFISNISHELRTPLHGILAAAELLGETNLNHSQASFLQTVQACGTSLVETVNHVLDFTKLSGGSKSGGVENAIIRTPVDLMMLVEDAIDGCWIGHQARTSALAYPSGIGSVYSPPKDEGSSVAATLKPNRVEAVVDIGYREQGWLLKCEKGGIRRVLMNVFGNSLKFTDDGFIHVILRQLPGSESDPANTVKVELAVLDTGKGISQNFLKNELFHPFSQENPLQTGTGLGLAIVNSIVQSDSVNGKIDVWSEENIGTEIKITFDAQVPENAGHNTGDVESFKFDDPANPVTVSLLGFDSNHRGAQLLRSVLQTYLVTWWGFGIRPGEDGDIVILNEDIDPVIAATGRRDTSRPFIILSSSRGSPALLNTASEHELIGGFCRVLLKPGGPSRLKAVLKLCIHALRISARSQISTPVQKSSPSELTEGVHALESLLSGLALIPSRRNSENNQSVPKRPLMSPRSTTAHPTAPVWKPLSSTSETDDESDDSNLDDPAMPTIAVGTGGTLLQSSIGALQAHERRSRILVVEDNSILRGLLVKWLSSKGYDFRDAVDGQDGVNVFEADGPFDIVLLDLSMPVLDGVGATAQIRQIEAKHQITHRTRILALTGMSSVDDKRRAFEAGVDGYLVKPVAFKTLDEMFKKLGLS